MKNILSIIDKRVQECEPSIEYVFNKMYEATSGMDREELPTLRLRYLIDDYPEFKKMTADSRPAHKK